MTFFINPGIPGREYFKKNFKITGKEKKNYNKCSKCNIIIPKNFKVVHCPRCEVCIGGTTLLFLQRKKRCIRL